MSDGVEAEVGIEVRKVPEESLLATFGGGGAKEAPAPVGKANRAAPGAFAKRFKCECPKCEKPVIGQLKVA